MLCKQEGICSGLEVCLSESGIMRADWLISQVVLLPAVVQNFLIVPRYQYESFSWINLRWFCGLSEATEPRNFRSSKKFWTASVLSVKWRVCGLRPVEN